MPRKKKVEVIDRRSSANGRQVGGSHYKRFALNHWDMVVLFELDYLLGASTKYMFRWQDKGGIEDLEKAAHYLQKKIEIEKLRKEGKLSRELLAAALSELDEDRP